MKKKFIKSKVRELEELHLKNPDVSTYHLCQWLQKTLDECWEEAEKELDKKVITYENPKMNYKNLTPNIL